MCERRVREHTRLPESRSCQLPPPPSKLHPGEAQAAGVGMCPLELTFAVFSWLSSLHEMSGTCILGGVAAGVWIPTAEGD